MSAIYGRAMANAALLPESENRRIYAQMTGFIYFNISDHARLPARFFGMTRNILACLS
jgi:hypothetical protein